MSNSMNIRLFTIPNLLTLANLLAGAVAVVMVLVHHSYETAMWLIIASAIFDFFDGFAARLLKQISPMGVELDSLADDISFGLVPAVMMFDIYSSTTSMYGFSGEVMSWLGYSVFIIAAFSALRLARFNIDTTQSSEFRGLPTPANALMLAALAVLFEQGRVELSQEYVLLISLAASLLLVSPIRMFALKFKGFAIKGNELRYGFMLVSLAIIILVPTYALISIIVLYIVISTLRWLFAPSQREA